MADITEYLNTTKGELHISSGDYSGAGIPNIRSLRLSSYDYVYDTEGNKKRSLLISDGGVIDEDKYPILASLSARVYTSTSLGLTSTNYPAVSSTDGEIIYTVIGGVLNISTDGGDSFNTTGYVMSSTNSYEYGLTCSADGSTVAYTDASGTYRSTDYGVSFSLIQNLSNNIRSMDMSSDGSIIYLTDFSNSVNYKSTNGGSLEVFSLIGGSTIQCNDLGTVVYKNGTGDDDTVSYHRLISSTGDSHLFSNSISTFKVSGDYIFVVTSDGYLHYSSDFFETEVILEGYNYTIGNVYEIEPDYIKSLVTDSGGNVTILNDTAIKYLPDMSNQEAAYGTEWRVVADLYEGEG